MMRLKQFYFAYAVLLSSQALITTGLIDEAAVARPFIPPSRLLVKLEDEHPQYHLPGPNVLFCLLKGVEELALQPFHTLFNTEGIVRQAYRFSGVQVEFVPYTSALRKFTHADALWQLYKCFLLMIARRYPVASCNSDWLISLRRREERAMLGFRPDTGDTLSNAPEPQDDEVSNATAPQPSSLVPIDYSTWDTSQHLTFNFTNSLNLTDQNVYTAKAGDFESPISVDLAFSLLYQSLISRASEPNRGIIPETQFTCDRDLCRAEPLFINYHRRPGEHIPPIPYEVLIHGLAFLPTAIARRGTSRFFYECKFVLFRNERPLVDGWIRRGRG